MRGHAVDVVRLRREVGGRGRVGGCAAGVVGWDGGLAGGEGGGSSGSGMCGCEMSAGSERKSCGFSREAEEVVMVAAHAYDLRGAQKTGLKTIYIHRWTDDVDEDMEKVKTEFDVFLEDMKDLPSVIARI